MLAPKVKVINIAITNLMYKWETKATDGNWEEISSAGVLLLYPKLMGKLVRLCCFGPGEYIFWELFHSLKIKIMSLTSKRIALA